MIPKKYLILTIVFCMALASLSVQADMVVLKTGKAALSSIHYAFWRDRLYMVTIRTKGRSNYTALRDEVFRQFGQGHRADPSFEKYLWTDTPNDMMLHYSKEGQQGLFWLRSSDIGRQYKLSKISGPASYLKWIKSRN